MTRAISSTGVDLAHDAPPMAKADWPAALARHDRWLRTVVWSRVGESAAVDEIVQEVALAAVKQAPALSEEAVAPWLYRVAVTQSLLYRRKQGRRRKLIEGYTRHRDPTERDARNRDPLDWLLAGERREMVRRALERLPRRDAEILMLKYTEDWSYQQIARHLGVSCSAVETRLHRARARLRSELAALDPVPTVV